MDKLCKTCIIVECVCVSFRDVVVRQDAGHSNKLCLCLVFHPTLDSCTKVVLCKGRVITV